MSVLNADLHCHSTASDGWLAPADVIRRAHANGVELLALTDHDTLAGLDEAFGTARELGLNLVAGVEISVTHAGDTVHIVGLNVSPSNPVLLAGLASVREGRSERARRIASALEQVGIEGALEGAGRFAHNPEMIGRAHFARHIVARGLQPDVGSVFRHYLAKGKPGYVDHEWARLSDAVSWIRAAGGIAVIAHPARYRRTSLQMDALFDDFVACGGEGVEVVSGSHTSDEVSRFAGYARRYGLLASRASDFHGVNESASDLGGCAPLPAGVEPVWTRFASANRH